MRWLSGHGQKHDWKQCGPKNPKSVCHACEAKERCAYYKRASEEAKPILVMTHAGLVRLIESGSPLLADARVIVDEDLSVFADCEVSLAELRLVQDYNVTPLPWKALPAVPSAGVGKPWGRMRFRSENNNERRQSKYRNRSG